MKVLVSVAIFGFALSLANAQCDPSVTTASGTHAPGTICSGQLIFEDNFDTLDQAKWRHEVSLFGGYNEEFQWYVNDRDNSFIQEGSLHLKPTFTADIFGEEFLRSGRVYIPPDLCTNSDNYGCDKQATYDNIINPIRSAKVSSQNAFNFKFGTVEIRAKTPSGDWIWPAMWMMPKQVLYGSWPTSVYGGWPASGEIDIMELRGNRNLYADGGGHVGVEQVGSTIHFGPSEYIKNQWPLTHFAKNQQPSWDADFHTYRFVWTPDRIQFLVDGEVIGTVDAGTGFWDLGGFESSGLPNPWTNGTVMAPFDIEYFIMLNNAIGGTSYFDDSFVNQPYPKPWLNTSPRAAADFWEHRGEWEPTWNKANTDDSHLKIDYVCVWAL